MKLSHYLSQLGRKGGRAGRGAAKRRGNRAHYQRLARLAAAARARARSASAG